MSDKVLDSFALIAYFRGESGSELVEHLLISAKDENKPLLMSDVNYAELKFTLIRKEGIERWNDVAEVLRTLPVKLISTTKSLADSAADFKTRFRMSLADAFAAALAKERNAELVTGDREFKPVTEVRIVWIRNQTKR